MTFVQTDLGGDWPAALAELGCARIQRKDGSDLHSIGAVELSLGSAPELTFWPRSLATER